MEDSPSRSTPMVGNVWTAQPASKRANTMVTERLSPRTILQDMTELPPGTLA